MSEILSIIADVIQVIANNPSSICIVLGILMAIAGYVLQLGFFLVFGIIVFVTGVLLNVLWNINR